MTLPFTESFLSLSRSSHEMFSQSMCFTLDNQTQVSIVAAGVIAFEPPESPNKSVVYSCGIHGNETAPIEICDELVQAVLSEKIILKQRLMVIFGNLPAMDKAARFIQENLNRLFSGQHAEPSSGQNDERRRARLLENCVTSFFNHGDNALQRCHYDLHTAIRESKNEKFAVYPYLHGKQVDSAQLRFLAACGVKTILLSQSPTSTFSYYSSRTHGAHAFTVELGKVKPFGENDMTRFEEAKNALYGLVCEQIYTPESDLSEVVLYRVNQVINKQVEDFKLHFADDTPNFTDFNKGAVLASETGSTYIAEQDGEAIVFPNADVAIGQRALLTVVPTKLNAD